MKGILLISMALITFHLYGQIQINDSTFPKVGDTLFTFEAVEPEIDIKASSSGQLNWDFNSLPKSNSDFSPVLRPDHSDHAELYPDADLLIIQRGLEFFYQVESNKIIEIGAVGVDPVLGLLDIAYRYNGERVMRRSPLIYNQAFEDEYDLQLSESVEKLPEDIQEAIEQLSVDSLRIETHVQEQSIVDAYGELVLHDEEYEVLRVKTTNYIQSVLYARNPFAGWVELNPESVNIPGITDLLGMDTVVVYNFYANEEINPVAQVTVNNETSEPTSAVYKNDDYVLNTVKIIDKKYLKTYPNPTYGEINFELNHYPPDRYSVDIYNIIGKKLESHAFKNGSSRLKINLSHLRKGTYLYSIVNSNGKKW